MSLLHMHSALGSNKLIERDEFLSSWKKLAHKKDVNLVGPEIELARSFIQLFFIQLNFTVDALCRKCARFRQWK
jgi:hypothetical protein